MIINPSSFNHVCSLVDHRNAIAIFTLFVIPGIAPEATFVTHKIGRESPSVRPSVCLNVCSVDEEERLVFLSLKDVSFECLFCILTCAIASCVMHLLWIVVLLCLAVHFLRSLQGIMMGNGDSSMECSLWCEFWLFVCARCFCFFFVVLFFLTFL